MTQYRTVTAVARAEYTVKRSRFIGQIFPAESFAQVMQELNEIKAQNREARHHVYACLLREGQTQRYSDDGEPQGTGGIPALEVLRREGLIDCAMVVTRYFGGVLLGAPGLTRAYAHSAKLAVGAAKIITMAKCLQLRLVCDYKLYGKLAALIPEQSGIIEQIEYGDKVLLRYRVPLELAPSLDQKLRDVSFGKLQLDNMTEIWAEIP